MGCFAAFLAFMVAAIWLLGLASARYARRSSQRRLLSSLRRQFGGTYSSGGIFGTPLLVLQYGEAWIAISQMHSRGPFPGSCFQVRIHWSHAATSCEVVSLRQNDLYLATPTTWPSVDIGGDFKNNFEVSGPDAEEVRCLLTSGVRWQVERLANVGPGRRLRILIRDGRIWVQKPWTKPHGEAAAQFVQGALELYDQCMLAKATGIQFLHTDEAQTLDHVLCQICGEEIQDQMVVCRRCKTPHHQDCWEYTGSCSVFGCRETKYLLPH